MKDIILASTSSYREELLRRLGIPFRSLAPLCDEEGADDLPVEERAVHLAVRKARSLASQYPGAIVIGADQIPEIDGQALKKPGTAEKARESLRLLSGKSHSLVTGVALVQIIDDEHVETGVDVTRIHMRDLSDQEIESYVKREHVLNCAGAYKAEGLGIALFQSIETTDPTAEVGLPLIQVTELLRRFGVDTLR